MYGTCAVSAAGHTNTQWQYLPEYQSGPVLWTYTGRKTLPPSTSLPVMGEIAGVNTVSLGEYLHSTKTRARWAEGFHEFNGHVFDLERDGLRQVVLCPRLTMRWWWWWWMISPREPSKCLKTWYSLRADVMIWFFPEAKHLSILIWMKEKQAYQNYETSNERHLF